MSVSIGQVELRGDPGEGSYYIQFLPDEPAFLPVTTHEVKIPGLRSLVNIDVTPSGSLFGVEVLH